MLHDAISTRRRFIQIGGGFALSLVAPAGVSTVRTAFADDTGFPFGSTVRVATDALNLRFDPSLSAGVVTVLYTGAVGTIESDPVAKDGYTWQQAKFGAVDGWTAIDYLEAYNPGNSFTAGDTVVVATDALNLRAAAGIDAAVLATLATGAIGTITGGPTSKDGYAWYEVNFGQDGWVDGEYLNILDDSASTFKFADKVVVATDRLNLRFAPGTDSQVLFVLAQGDQGTITGPARYLDGYVWYEAGFSGGRSGFAAGDYLQLSDGGGSTPSASLVVVDGPLNVRNAPSLSGVVLDTIPTGATLSVLQADSGTDADGYHWIYVQVDDSSGVQGFIADAFTAAAS